MHPTSERQDGVGGGAPVKRPIAPDMVEDPLPAQQSVVEGAEAEIAFVDHRESLQGGRGGFAPPGRSALRDRVAERRVGRRGVGRRIQR
jgi:hypothetical protein